ncbi:MAG: YceD family protein [Jiangellaceae bacterium]
MVLLSTLDPRAPLVLDTHELGRRPGAMRRVRLTVPAPADLGLGGVVGVPEGADLELDLRLESVMEGVLVSGTARATLAGECARCLDPVDSEIDVDIQELYAYPDRAVGNGAESGAGEGEMVEDDLVDLETAIRDAVVLALPQAPLCRDDCPGLCPQCGARLADDPGHSHETGDPRWAALAGLLAENHETRDTGSDRAGPIEEK